MGIIKGLMSIKRWVAKLFYASEEWLAKDESDLPFFNNVPYRFENLGKMSYPLIVSHFD